MKKFWQRAGLLLAIFALTACGSDPVSSSEPISEEPSNSLTSEPSDSKDSSESEVESELPIDEKIYWEGIEDTIVQLGDEFDLLTGVRAYDHTGDLEVEVTDDDYFTPHYVGSYEIEYETTNDAGETDTVYRYLQVIKGVNVENGGFEFSSANWRFDQPGGSGTFKVLKDANSNSYAEINVTNAGTEAWALQLYQTGLRFESGKTYELSFEMSSAANRSVAAGFEDVANNYAMLNPGYQAQIVPTEKGLYTSYYTASHDVGNVKAVIYLGQGLEVDDSASKDNPLDIKIDNVRVRKIEIAPAATRPVFANGGSVTVIAKDQFDALEPVTATDYNGNDISDKIEIFGDVPTFVNAQTRMIVSYRVEDDEGNFNFINRTVHYQIPRASPYNMINADFDNGPQGWIFDVNQTNGTPEAEFIDNGDSTVSVNVTNPSNANWHIQLYQNGVNLSAGKVYRTTLVLKSDAAHRVAVEISNPSAGFAAVVTESLDLTTEFQTFEVEYRAQSKMTAKVSLLLANSGRHLITIDRFENEEIDPSEASIDMRDYEKHEVINGDFMFGLYGFTGEANEGANVDYSADREAGVVKATINTQAAVDWHAQLQQSGKAYAAGKTYQIELVASALDPATIKVEVSNNNGETKLITESVALTAEETTFTFTFTPSIAANNAKIALLFGETIPTTITINSLIITDITV